VVIKVYYVFLFCQSKIFDNNHVKFIREYFDLSFLFLSIDFNGRYRADYPHMVITYIVRDEKGTHEYQAGWQMNDMTYNQWKTAIERLRDSHPPSELA